MSRLSIDSSRCQGHGRCYSLFPAMFACADEEGHAEVSRPNVDGSEVTDAARAVQECPERAISLT